MAVSSPRPVEHFREKTTSFLRDLASHSPALRAIYFYDAATEGRLVNLDRDILLEKKNSPLKGAVYKFHGRILILLSYTCAANCRFCERQDRVGVGLDSEGRLRPEDIVAITELIQERKEINEVILSGGDPLTHPAGMRLICSLLAKVPNIKILRIHTRLPVQQPTFVDLDLLRAISEMFRTCYLSVHIDHPDELTPETEEVLLSIRRLGFILLAQTVFLKGVNDKAATLARLFSRLSELGIRPYYIYHCQAIPTTMHFVMSLEDEIAIMTALREILSGVAFPQHVIDIQRARGKIVVPTSHWLVDTAKFRDFDGNWLDAEERLMHSHED